MLFASYHKTDDFWALVPAYKLSQYELSGSGIHCKSGLWCLDSEGEERDTCFCVHLCLCEIYFFVLTCVSVCFWAHCEQACFLFVCLSLLGITVKRSIMAKIRLKKHLCFRNLYFQPKEMTLWKLFLIHTWQLDLSCLILFILN